MHDPGEPIEGEVVGDADGSGGRREPRNAPRGTEGRALQPHVNGRWTSPYTEDDIEQAIHLRAIGFTPTEIATKMAERLGRPVSPATVRSWFQSRIADHHPARLDLAQTQARMLVELEGMQHEAMRVARMYPGSDLAIRGIAQARNVLATRAALLGIEQPKRPDVDPNEALTHDPELLKLVQEARDEAWNDMKQVKEQFERRANP